MPMSVHDHLRINGYGVGIDDEGKSVWNVDSVNDWKVPGMAVEWIEVVHAELDRGRTFEEAMRVGLRSILVSPRFLLLEESPGPLTSSRVPRGCPISFAAACPAGAIHERNSLAYPQYYFRMKKNGDLNHVKAKARFPIPSHWLYNGLHRVNVNRKLDGLSRAALYRCDQSRCFATRALECRKLWRRGVEI